MALVLQTFQDIFWNSKKNCIHHMYLKIILRSWRSSWGTGVLPIPPSPWVDQRHHPKISYGILIWSCWTIFLAITKKCFDLMWPDVAPDGVAFVSYVHNLLIRNRKSSMGQLFPWWPLLLLAGVHASAISLISELLIGGVGVGHATFIFHLFLWLIIIIFTLIINC